MNGYKSGGISPYVVGGGMVLFGGLSAVMSMFSDADPIINTTHGNGANAIFAIVTAGIGFLIFKSRNSLAAWGFGACAIALMAYGHYTVDVKRTVNVATAAGEAAMSAASAATNAAQNSASTSYYQYSQPKGGNYRNLGALENQQCDEGRLPWTKTQIGIEYCSSRTCPVDKCTLPGCEVDHEYSVLPRRPTYLCQNRNRQTALQCLRLKIPQAGDMSRPQ